MVTQYEISDYRRSNCSASVLTDTEIAAAILNYGDLAADALMGNYKETGR